MSIKVIGPAFGRTGTDSMREALTILGFGPCHHMYEVIASEEQTRLWRAVAGGAKPDWDKLLAGYVSCVDWPSAFYWRELIAAYPQARVVLTCRSPESWWTSFKNTILPSLDLSEDNPRLSSTLIARQVFGGRPQDREHAMACYEANVQSVRETVAPERLLVHNLGDGWAPLCAHLGVPVPDEPYPDRHSTGEFQAAARAREG